MNKMVVGHLEVGPLSETTTWWGGGGPFLNYLRFRGGPPGALRGFRPSSLFCFHFSSVSISITISIPVLFLISYPPAHFPFDIYSAGGRGCLHRRVAYMIAPEDCCGKHSRRFRLGEYEMGIGNWIGNRNGIGNETEMEIKKMMMGGSPGGARRPRNRKESGKGTPPPTTLVP